MTVTYNFSRGRISSGVFCPKCGSEMLYLNHSKGCFRVGLACVRCGFVRDAPDEELRLKFSTVLGLFLSGGEVLPLRVQRITWAVGSYSVVRKALMKESNFEFYGSFCSVRKYPRVCDVRLDKLSRAEFHEWIKIEC